jgi:lipopolysaccharide assembly outer membrane protein LptD (OstA)
MRYRVALLALYFSVPALAQSVPPAQAQGATTVDAEAIEGVGDLEVTARGNAEIRRDDVTIFGELLRYNAEFGRVQGEAACACSATATASTARACSSTRSRTAARWRVLAT